MQHYKLRGGFKAFLLIQFLLNPALIFVLHVSQMLKQMKRQFEHTWSWSKKENNLKFLFHFSPQIEGLEDQQQTQVLLLTQTRNQWILLHPTLLIEADKTIIIKKKVTKSCLWVLAIIHVYTCTLKHLSLNGSYIIELVPDILCSFALTLYKPITLLDRNLLLVPMKCGKKNSPLSQRASCNYVKYYCNPIAVLLVWSIINYRYMC